MQFPRALPGLRSTLLSTFEAQPVFAACAAIGLQAGVAIPLVPLALERQGADKLTIGIVSAAWALGMLATASYIPRLAARFGAVPFILASVDELDAKINQVRRAIAEDPSPDEFTGWQKRLGRVLYKGNP